MPHVASFLLHQPIPVQVALYVVTVVTLALAGARSFLRVIELLGVAGEVIASNEVWQALAGSRSKLDALLSLGALVYAAVLVALEPAIRALSSELGEAVVTSLMIAPLLGAAIQRKDLQD